MRDQRAGEEYIRENKGKSRIKVASLCLGIRMEMSSHSCCEGGNLMSRGVYWMLMAGRCLG